MKSGSTFPVLAAAFFLASLAWAERPAVLPAGTYQLSLSPRKKTNLDQAMPFLAKVLGAGGKVLLPLPSERQRLFDGQSLDADALKDLLRSQGPYYLPVEDSALVEAARDAFPDVRLSTLRSDKGPQIVCLVRGLPKVAVIENVSSVSPLSAGLKQQGWPYVSLDFGRIEASAAGWMDARRYDFISLSSPGWWYNFADPPSGPSRMGDNVANALRSFVTGGGTTYFCDIAQTDMEKAWPDSVRLDSLGPTKDRLFQMPPSGKTVALSLANFGDAAVGIRVEAFSIFKAPKYAFPEGEPRLALGAYAFKDPAKGSGLVYGQSLNTFDQDGEGAVAARNALLDLLLVSNPRRLSAWVGAAPPPMPSPTLQPSPTQAPVQVQSLATVIPSPVPPTVTSPTPAPTDTAMPTVPVPPATATETREPTPAPTLAPSPFQGQASPADSPTVPPTPKPTAEAGTKAHAKVLGCLQAAPNPFGEGGTFIYFCLKTDAWARLSIFDLKGKLLRVVKSGQEVAGNKQWYFDGKDSQGKVLDAGTYYYSVDARNEATKDQSFDRMQRE
jgi:hypothetical protein